MIAGAFSDTITRGVDYFLGLRLQDDNRGPYLDLSEWTFTAVLTSSAGAQLATLSADLVTPINDCIRFSLDTTQTGALAAQTGAHLAISGTRPDGVKLPLVSARITITNI